HLFPKLSAPTSTAGTIENRKVQRVPALAGHAIGVSVASARSPVLGENLLRIADAGLLCHPALDEEPVPVARLLGDVEDRGSPECRPQRFEAHSLAPGSPLSPPPVMRYRHPRRTGPPVWVACRGAAA